MSDKRRILGLWGERWVERRFTRRGYFIIDTHVRIDRTEWDLLMWRDFKCVLIEVRTRSGSLGGELRDFLPYRKRQRLIRSMVRSGDQLREAYPSLSFQWVQFLAVTVFRGKRSVRHKVHEVVDWR